MTTPRTRSLCAYALVCSLTSCVQAAPPQSYGDPTTLGHPTNVGGIVASLIAPSALSPSEHPNAEVVVSAFDAADPSAPLRVLLLEGPSARAATPGADAPGEGATYSVRPGLVHGQNLLRFVMMREDASKRRELVFPLAYAGDDPGIRITESTTGRCSHDDRDPVVGAVTSADTICVRGFATAMTGASVTEVRVRREDGAASSATLEPDGSFGAEVELDADTTHYLTLAATDDAGRVSTIAREVRRDTTPPALELTAPDDIDPALAHVMIRGRVTDESGTNSSTLALLSAAGTSTVPLEADGSFAVKVLLEPGENTLVFLATDEAGNVTRALLPLTRPRIIRLGPPAAQAGGATLELDRDALEELLSVEAQQQLKLVELKLRPAIVAALRALRQPERFGVDTSSWGEPERNLFRLLNMTPDTADLTGSSLEELLAIGQAIGLPTQRIIAEVFDLGTTETFVDLEVAADVLLEQLIATHPEANRDADGSVILELSMYDVLQDLRPVSARFGPNGSHPGFLKGERASPVLETGFLMALDATTNLVQVDGVDLTAQTKDYLFVLEGDQALSFDFERDETFTIAGVQDEPTVDLVLKIEEHDRFLTPGNRRDERPDPERPGFSRGSGEVWGTPPWLLGSLIAESAYRSYHARFRTQAFARSSTWDASAIADALRITWERGWLTFQTSGDLGNPPDPLFAWDLLLEVTQLRLHDGGVPPGGATVTFTLEDLPIGLTADELIAALRPTLQAQSAELSELLVGANGLATSDVDIFLSPGDTHGTHFLFYRAPSDAPAEPYDWVTPGFFGPVTADKRSDTAPLPGTQDDAHEKVEARAGDSWLVYTRAGAPMLLEVHSVDPQGAAITLEPTQQEGTQ